MHVVGVDNFIYQFICIVLEENVEENEERMMYRDCLEWEWVEALNRVVREGHIDKVTFDQSHERGEGMSHADIWGKYIPDRRISKCRDWVESMPRLL